MPRRYNYHAPKAPTGLKDCVTTALCSAIPAPGPTRAAKFGEDYSEGRATGLLHVRLLDVGDPLRLNVDNLQKHQKIKDGPHGTGGGRGGCELQAEPRLCRSTRLSACYKSLSCFVGGAISDRQSNLQRQEPEHGE